MTEPTKSPLFAPRRLIVASVLLLLVIGVPVVIALMKQRQDVVLTIDAPAGEAVYIDLVVDSRAESLVESVPVTCTRRCRELSYAVVPVDPAAGPVSITVTSGRRHVSGTSAGVTGRCQGNLFWGANVFGGMSTTHVITMRAAAQSRVEESTGSR